EHLYSRLLVQLCVTTCQTSFQYESARNRGASSRYYTKKVSTRLAGMTLGHMGLTLVQFRELSQDCCLSHLQALSAANSDNSGRYVCTTHVSLSAVYSTQ